MMGPVVRVGLLSRREGKRKCYAKRVSGCGVTWSQDPIDTARCGDPGELLRRLPPGPDSWMETDGRPSSRDMAVSEKLHEGGLPLTPIRYLRWPPSGLQPRYRSFTVCCRDTPRRSPDDGRKSGSVAMGKHVRGGPDECLVRHGGGW